MMQRLLMTSAAAAALVVLPAHAATPADFDWRGRLEPGQTLEIRGINGYIRAQGGTDAFARVEADRHGRRSDPGSVRIEVVEHEGGVTICAVYPTPRGTRRENECRPGGGPNQTGRNDVEVDFVVSVPPGVEFAGHTVNGDVDVDGLTGDVTAETVNGDVAVDTEGFADATTVNGDITCRVGRNGFGEDVGFETVNGSITVEVLEGLNADLHASTVNGSIDSDFPILVTGKVNRRSLRGTIGEGGPTLRLSTVNGSIRLRRL